MPNSHNYIPLDQWIKSLHSKDPIYLRTATYWAEKGKIDAKKMTDVVEVKLRRKVRKWFVREDAIPPK